MVLKYDYGEQSIRLTSQRLNPLLMDIARNFNCLFLWEFLPFKCSGPIQSGIDLTRKNIYIDLYETEFFFSFETQLTVCSTMMWWVCYISSHCGIKCSWWLVWLSCSESLCCELSLMCFFFCQSLPLAISVCIFFSFDSVLAQSQDWSKSFP